MSATAARNWRTPRQRQMAKLAYASAYAGFSNEPAIRLAERMVGLAYGNMAAAYFTTGGAESNESAFKFARYYWKRMGKPNKVKIISRRYGYHGVTLAAMSATSLPGYHKMFGPLVPEFLQVAPPYPYRWPGNGDAGIEAADAVEEAIKAQGADTIAAVIAEPVMGAGGVIVPPPTYFPRLRRDLRPPRRAADRRRGDHRLRPHRPLVRARPLGRRARPDVVRQGRHQRLSAAGRRDRVEARAPGDRGRADGREVHARRDLFRPSGVLRRRPAPTSTSSSAKDWSNAPR